MTRDFSNDQALPPDYQLHEYRIESVLGRGGFGITYRALDTQRNQVVALKEFFPNVASRREGISVCLEPEHEEALPLFHRGRRTFIEEARVIARFSHPNLVKVIESFEANGTGYLVMNLEPGVSLARLLREQGRAPNEGELKALLTPLLNALTVVHGGGCLHRDITPHNIIVRPDGSPVLIDFGAARQSMSPRGRDDDHADRRAPLPVVTHGYAAPEQYLPKGKQGPWTDIYALGAVLYRAMTGGKPPDAPRRLSEDPCQPVATVSHADYSAEFMAAVDWALRPDLKQRPQSLAHWRAKLLLNSGPLVEAGAEDDQAHAKALAAAVAALPEEPLPLAATPPTNAAPPPPPKPQKRRPWLRRSSRPSLGARTGSALRRLGMRVAVVGLISLAVLVGASWWSLTQARWTKLDRLRQEAAPTGVETERQRPVAATVAAMPSDEGSRRAEEAARQAEEEQRQEQELARLAATLPVGRVFRDCRELDKYSRPVCPEMVVTPPGVFVMGSPEDEVGRKPDEGPQRRVAITTPLAVGRYEVTRGEFSAFVRETKHVTATGCYVFSGSEWREDERRTWRKPGYDQSEHHPVVCVSWQDAQAYVLWLRTKTRLPYRLPSEAEWEYLARAGTNTPYATGFWLTPESANYNLLLAASIGAPGSAPPPSAATLRGRGHPVDVGTYPANPFGLSDMHGNVWEWVEDCYHDGYAAAPPDSRAWVHPGCEVRTLRGGSWLNAPIDLRSADRSRSSPDDRSSNIGFRVVRPLTD
ncbi:formylglycine-generating enzyme [uncultured Gammaproteobacteria bacterium]